MVMGPSCGMILADLGADVIKIEPAPEGDNTRRLTGPARLLSDLQPQQAQPGAWTSRSPRAWPWCEARRRRADVLIENFRPGAMDKLGLGYAALAELNPRLIYCSLQGLPARPLRAPHGARRGGADDGRARLHDRPARPAVARRLLGQRHHGRHVRR